MVTARAPARPLGDIGVLLHRLMGGTAFKPYTFSRPDDSAEQLEIVGAVRRTLSTLTPATRRMLDTVCQALTVRADPASGLEFRGCVNRADIAAAMGKPRLVPYDLQKLNKLVDSRLLSEDYRALPTMTVRGADGKELQYGAGGEYIYHIPPKIMYALITINDPGSLQLLELRSKARTKPEYPGVPAVERAAVEIQGALHLVPEQTPRRWWRDMTTRQALMLMMLVLTVASVWIAAAALVLRQSLG